jgi:hypothetical protein
MIPHPSRHPTRTTRLAQPFTKFSVAVHRLQPINVVMIGSSSANGGEVVLGAGELAKRGAETPPVAKRIAARDFSAASTQSSDRMSLHRAWGMPSSRLRARALAVIERERPSPRQAEPFQGCVYDSRRLYLLEPLGSLSHVRPSLVRAQIDQCSISDCFQIRLRRHPLLLLANDLVTETCSATRFV